MARTRIQWNKAGFEALLRHPAVKADLFRRAEKIAEAVGELGGYVARSGEGKTRSRAAVIAATYRARRDNAANQTLLKSIDAGR